MTCDAPARTQRPGTNKTALGGKAMKEKQEDGATGCAHDAVRAGTGCGNLFMGQRDVETQSENFDTGIKLMQTKVVFFIRPSKKTTNPFVKNVRFPSFLTFPAPRRKHRFLTNLSCGAFFTYCDSFPER